MAAKKVAKTGSAKRAPAARAVKDRPKPQNVPRAKPKAAAKPDGQRDFLVVYEEPDPYGLPTEDALILDIEANIAKRGQVDVQQKLALELTNTTSRLGTFGFLTACIGSILGLILMITFAVIYPEQWYDAQGAIQRTAIVKSLILLSIVAILLMVTGTVLTHYGRRIQARGNLSDVRLVEREPVASAQFQ